MCDRPFPLNQLQTVDAIIFIYKALLAIALDDRKKSAVFDHRTAQKLSAIWFCVLTKSSSAIN
ncbi:hypothetical protein HCU40_18120 [Pseudanabaena biceps]|nr:hypothetical protein [Pseudanabaena biceps]